jgi:AraC-like DNA-binding protein
VISSGMTASLALDMRHSLVRSVTVLLTFCARTFGVTRQKQHRGVTTTALVADHAARSEEWRAELAAAFGRLRPEVSDDPQAGPLPRTVLDGRMTAATLGRVGAFRVAGTPQIVRRTSTSITEAPADPLKVCIQQTGRAVVHQGDVEVVIRPGELALYDTGRPYDLRLEGNWVCVVMTIPRDALTMPASLVSAAMTHSFCADSGPGAVLTHLLDSALEDFSSGADDGACQLGEAGVLLMASLVRSAGLAAAPAEDALRTRVLTYLSAQLADPGLSHASVAAAHGMSARSLHRLFEREPHTVTEAIRAMRLDRIRTELVDPVSARRSTMAIAARWGFQDPAHFTRAFRSRFGVTPAALRREAIGR